MTAMNAAGRHGARARVSRRLNRCALKAASETSNAKSVLNATPKPPEEPELPVGTGSGAGGALGEALPGKDPATEAAARGAVATAPPSPTSECKREEKSRPAAPAFAPDRRPESP